MDLAASESNTNINTTATKKRILKYIFVKAENCKQNQVPFEVSQAECMQIVQDISIENLFKIYSASFRDLE